MLRLSLFALLLLAASAPAAQVSGTVRDDAGAAVPGAQVLLRTSGLIASTVATNAQGDFLFPSVSGGTYSLQVSNPSFTTRTLAIQVAEAHLELTVQLSIAPTTSHVTVTAEAGRVEEIDRIAQRVNVLQTPALSHRSATVFAEVLREEPGVDLQRTTAVMGGVMIRGLLGKNVAVFKDGVRYTTSAQRGGVSTFFNLNEVTSLDSVEILRGPNGAQYGSDSIGGTVNLISASPSLGGITGWHGDFATHYGSAANSFGGNARANYGTSRFGLLMNAAATRVNTLRTGQGVDSHAAVTRFLGLPSTLLGYRLADTAFTQYSGMLHSQFTITPTQQVVSHYERSQQDGGKRADQLLGGDGNLIADLRNLMLDFGYLRYANFDAGPLDSFTTTLSYNAQREQRVNQGGNGNPLGAITSQYERTAVWGLNLSASKRLRTHTLLLGADGYLERETSPAYTLTPASGLTLPSRPRLPNGARYLQHGVFAQDAWELGRLRLSGAIRFGGASYRSSAANSPLLNGASLWPDDSAATRALSGRFGGVVRLYGPLRAFANYSRGFRAPSMTDLGTVGIQGNGFFEASFADLSSSGAFLGNRADDLAVSSGRPLSQVRPERSDNYDIGLQLTTSRFRTEVTGLVLDLHDTIVSQTLILPAGAVGATLGDQRITRQLASGAVFVPAATAPVLVRGNLGRVRIHGIEHALEAKLTTSLSVRQNITWLYAEDRLTGLPPDIEGGIQPLTGNLSIRWAPRPRWWFEPYALFADRQDRLSSLALADRRTGAARSRTNIANFFNNGARVRGIVQNGILQSTGETLAQVQQRVVGSANSAPLFHAIPGYMVAGLRGGVRVTESSDLFLDFSNLADKNYRGISWGVDGPGRSITIKYRMRF